MLFIATIVPLTVSSDDPYIPQADVYVCGTMGAGWYDATHVATIAEGITNVSSGGTIYVWNGTYSETLTINKPFTMEGNSTSGTLIRGASTVSTITGVDGLTFRNLNISRTGGVDTFELQYCNNTVFDNIHFINGYSTMDYDDSNNITVSNCVIRNFYAYGLQYNDNSWINITQCTFIDCDTDMYFLGCSHANISHCHAYNHPGDAVAFMVLWTDNDCYGTIYDCDIEDNIGNSGVYLSGKHNKVLKSRISNCSSGIVQSSNYNSFFTEFKSNVIRDCSDEGIQLNYPQSSSSYGIVAHNIIKNCTYAMELDDTRYWDIYDNYFNNSIEFSGTVHSNNWNISKTTAPNIVGGPYQGGNFWSAYSGVNRGDGFGSTNYTIRQWSDIDYLPLVDDYYQVYVDDDKPAQWYDVYHVATIPEAITNITNGTIYVWEGTYDEEVTINKEVTLIGNGTNSIITNLTIVSNDNVTIMNLNFTRSGSGDAIRLSSKNNITVKNCEFYNLDSAILMFSALEGFNFTGCNCTKCGLNDGCLEFNWGSGTSQNNVVYDNEFYNIGTEETIYMGDSVGDFVVASNVFKNTDDVTLRSSESANHIYNNSFIGSSTTIAVGDNDVISYNTISDASSAFSCYASNADIHHNNITTVENYAFYFGTSASDVQIYSNNITGVDTVAYSQSGIVDATFYNNYISYDSSKSSGTGYDKIIWNTTKTTGPNIIGGPSIGGNYWVQYTTAVDTTGDGFASQYQINTGVYDYLPLTNNLTTIFVSADQSAGWYNEHRVHTIAEAITNASDGWTVYVWNGSYNEQVTISKRLDIIGNTSANVTITAPSSPVIKVSSDHVNISNVNVTGSGFIGLDIINSIDYVRITDSRFYGLKYGITNQSYHNLDFINISDCNFTHISSTAIRFYPDSYSDNVTVDNNEFYGNDGDMDYGVIIHRGDDCTISNNQFKQLYYNSLLLNDDACQRNTVENNTFTNTNGGIWTYSTGHIKYNTFTDIPTNDYPISILAHDGMTYVHHNDIASCWRGIEFYNNGENATVYANNISTTNYSIFGGTGVSNVFVYNNRLYQDVGGTSFGEWNTTESIATNIIGGPTIGGNWWGQYTDANDTTGDGIADTHYEVFSGVYDELPITNNISLQTFYVSNSMGENWYDSNHTHTINDALTNLSDNGGTIYVWDGTYTETLAINKPNVNIIGNGTDVTTLQHSTGNLIHIYQSNINISHMYLKTTSSKNMHGIVKDTGTVNNLTFYDLHLYDFAYGIYVYDSVDDVTIKNCNISDCATVAGLMAVEIKQNCSNVTITNNEFYNNTQRCMFIYNSNDIAITHNIIKTTYYDAILTQYGKRFEISNNSITNSLYSAIYFKSSGHVKYNNIINCNHGITIEADEVSMVNQYYHHNIIDNAGGGAFAIGTPKGVQPIVYSNKIRNVSYCIYCYQSLSNGTFYNNNFTGIVNVNGKSLAGCSFNITQQTGPNIIGGQDIGGNYWSGYSGYTTGDGIGTTPYQTYVGGPYDYLPLTNKQDIIYVSGSMGAGWYDGAHVATIAESITNMSLNNSGTVYVWEGTYNEDLTVDKGITFIGNGTDRTNVSGAWTISHDNVTLQDMNLSKSSGTIISTGTSKDINIDGILFGGSASYGISSTTGKRINITNCTTSVDFGWYSIHFVGTTHCNVINNTFTNCDSWQIHGKYADYLNISDNFLTGSQLLEVCNYTTLYNNSFYKGYNAFMYSTLEVTECTETTIQNNQIYRSIGKAAIAIESGSNNNIIHNTINNTNYYGLEVSGTENNITIKNNIFANNSQSDSDYYDITLFDSCNDVLIYNNRFMTTNNNDFNRADAVSVNNVTLNTTQQTGPNIIGGQDIGGNKWSLYTGVDITGDGIGSTSYTIDGVTDYLPLTNTRQYATVYVSGSMGASWYNQTQVHTLAEAVTNISNVGGTVYVWNGTYTGGATVTKPITFIGNSTAKTNITTNEIDIESDNVSISNFNFIGSGSGNAIRTSGATWIRNTTIQNCKFYNFEQGFFAYSDVQNFNITGCNFTSCGLNDEASIQFNFGAPESTGLVIHNNEFYNGGDAIYMTEDCTIINNVFNIPGYHAIHATSSCDVMNAYNNTFRNVNYAIFGYGAGHIKYNTVESCNTFMGIYRDNINIHHNNISWCSTSGFYFGSASATNNNIYSNNITCRNFTFAQDCIGGNVIYNNYINVTNYVAWGTDRAYLEWNTTQREGTNIIGGPNIGGNYYVQYTTAVDTTGDGFASAYDIPPYDDATDYLPLTNNLSLTTCYVSNTQPAGWYDVNHLSTISEALTNISDTGGTIYVWDGWYTENINITKNLTVIGNATATVHLGASNQADYVIKVYADNVTVNNFEVLNSTHGVKIAPDSFLCNIENTTFTDITNTAVEVRGNCAEIKYATAGALYGVDNYANFLSVQNSSFTSTHTGVKTQGINTTIRDCNITQQEVAGCYGLNAENFSVRHTEFYDIRNGTSYAGAVIYHNVDGVRIHSNYMNLTEYALYEPNPTPGGLVCFYNNKVYNSDAGVDVGNLQQTASIGDCIMYTNNMTIDINETAYPVVYGSTLQSYTSCPIRMQDVTVISISDNVIIEGTYGMWLEVSTSVGNHIYDNTIRNCTTQGIHVVGGRVDVYNNTFDNITNDGIYSRFNNNSAIIYNVINNSIAGITVSHSISPRIYENNITNASTSAISCANSDGNIIHHNRIDNMIWLYQNDNSQAHNNTIAGSGSDIGISLQGVSIGIDIEANYIDNFEDGIKIFDSNRHVNISNNYIENSSRYGINVSGVYINSLCYNNYFANNGNHVYDTSSDVNDRYNTTQQTGPNIISGQDIGGNYYDNYTGVDTNGDGIGETVFVLGNGYIDYLPLTNNQELTNITNPFPANSSTSVARPPVNISVTVNGSVEFYLYFYNTTGISPQWTLMNNWTVSGKERCEMTSLDTWGWGTQFVWGNTTYTWKACAYNSTWLNNTYTFTTLADAGGANARNDVNDDNTVNVFDMSVDWGHRTLAGYKTYNRYYDVNDDDAVNSFDLSVIWDSV